MLHLESENLQKFKRSVVFRIFIILFSDGDYPYATSRAAKGGGGRDAAAAPECGAAARHHAQLQQVVHQGHLQLLEYR